MYLSRVAIDTHSYKTIHDLQQLESYHGWIENMFPNEKKFGIRTRKLWRMDTFSGRKFLLLLSEEVPDQNVLEKYGINGTASTIDYQKFLDKLKNGMQARFKLVVTPTYSKSSGKKSGKRGKVIQCLTIENQIKYLKNRSIKNGFKLDNNFTVTNIDSAMLKKKVKSKDDNDEHYIQYFVNQVCYEGNLLITNIDQFRKLLKDGMGKNKAYGCGLMTIIPQMG